MISWLGWLSTHHGSLKTFLIHAIKAIRIWTSNWVCHYTPISHNIKTMFNVWLNVLETRSCKGQQVAAKAVSSTRKRGQPEGEESCPAAPTVQNVQHLLNSEASMLSPAVITIIVLVGHCKGHFTRNCFSTTGKRALITWFDFFFLYRLLCKAPWRERGSSGHTGLM